jgi:DNA helicase IV
VGSRIAGQARDPAPAAGGEVLEFDAVVVVEPAAFMGTPGTGTDGGPDAGSDATVGGRLLYIALTRAVQELTIVHADPLPAALAA